jgi:hypothetical protein
MRANPLGAFSEAKVASIQQKWKTAWTGIDVARFGTD